jgi:hypothetical protein
MSAFSRGCLLRYQCAFTPRTIQLCFPSKSFQRPQFFSTSPLFLAAKKARPSQAIRQALPNTKPSFTPTKSTVPNPPAAIVRPSYATSLAQKAHSTLLYHAPSQTIFMVSSYSASAFCFSYAAFSFWANSLNAPADLAAWVPIAFSGICFSMACLGGYLLLSPARLIRTITAIPKQAKAISTAVGNPAGNAAPQLEIEVELRKMFPLPFFPARKITARPDEIVLPIPFSSTQPKPSTAAELRALRMQEEREKKELWEYDRSHILTSPFRHANRALFNLFKAMGRAWSREGFLKLEVKGSRYKLDVTGGWALEGGKALDRLTTLRSKL